MPVLLFLGYINSIKNKFWEEEHKQTVVIFLWKSMALQVIDTKGGGNFISLVLTWGQQ